MGWMCSLKSAMAMVRVSPPLCQWVFMFDGAALPGRPRTHICIFVERDHACPRCKGGYFGVGALGPLGHVAFSSQFPPFTSPSLKHMHAHRVR